MGYISMREVTEEDYKRFVASHKELVFSDVKKEVRIKIGERRRFSPKELHPDKFELETTTVWSFPHRGDWATHKGDFRGNWSPQVVRNLLLRYTEEGDVVLDQFVGSGTTLVECKLLGREGIGVDINPACIYLTRDRLNFTVEGFTPPKPQRTFVGDARNLDKIEDESIDFIATHPPYANIIPYSKERIEGDLSYVRSIDEYVREMRRVAEESFRVLKPGKFAAILVGDTRINKHYVPIAFRVMQAFLDAGFALREDIIKVQWQCKTTPLWRKRSAEHNFLLIMHEHLFVFRKPLPGEEKKLKDSMAWW